MDISAYMETGRSKWDSYESHYDRQYHFDCMDVIAGKGRYPKLDDIASRLGIPGKMGIDGSQVQEHYDKGNIDRKTGELKGYTQDMGRASVVAAVQAVKEGKVVLVVDDESRENEGDFIMAAEKATPETVGYMVLHSSGVLCVHKAPLCKAAANIHVRVVGRSRSGSDVRAL